MGEKSGIFHECSSDCDCSATENIVALWLWCSGTFISYFVHTKFYVTRHTVDVLGVQSVDVVVYVFIIDWILKTPQYCVCACVLQADDAGSSEMCVCSSASMCSAIGLIKTAARLQAEHHCGHPCCNPHAMLSIGNCDYMNMNMLALEL